MTFDRFVGLPYADKGRGPTYDCWGLLLAVMRELRGIELPSYSDRYVTAEDREALAALIADELDPWDEIIAGQEQAFDAVLMREGRFPRHVGIVTEPGRLLHVSAGETSMIERYREGPLKHRVVGFYRYRDHE
ncbi:NlpC/P60 family protein [Tardiphaga sp. 839_C3_N1_4]|uniref:NlpC/P60 family protein n=1 Tax=Tardiphaga sp. 839_C3_N1_4 TaxID=3240761 RepID=UPI003F1FAAAA